MGTREMGSGLRREIYGIGIGDTDQHSKGMETPARRRAMGARRDETGIGMGTREQHTQIHTQLVLTK
jgi:hypothetical protein